MTQCALGNAVVVGREVELESGLQFRCAGEPGLRHQLADAAIESLDHAVGLGVAWRSQPVLDAQAGACHVEGMFARSLFGTAGEAVGELAAVVGEHLLDDHRRHTLQPAEEVGAAGLRLVAVGPEVHPARGPVDGHEQVAPVPLVGHLRQVLDVHVQVARLVVLEGLLDGNFAFDDRHQAGQVAHAVTPQATVQSGSRGIRVDELMRERKQVIQRQQQRAPQLHHQRLLRRRQRRAELVRTVRAVLHVLPATPLSHRRYSDVVALGKLGQRRFGGTNLLPRPGCRSGLGVNLAHACCSRLKDSITSRISPRALNSGQLRTGT